MNETSQFGDLISSLVNIGSRFSTTFAMCCPPLGSPTSLHLQRLGHVLPSAGLSIQLHLRLVQLGACSTSSDAQFSFPTPLL